MHAQRFQGLGDGSMALSCLITRPFLFFCCGVPYLTVPAPVKPHWIKSIITEETSPAKLQIQYRRIYTLDSMDMDHRARRSSRMMNSIQGGGGGLHRVGPVCW